MRGERCFDVSYALFPRDELIRLNSLDARRSSLARLFTSADYNVQISAECMILSPSATNVPTSFAQLSMATLN